MNAKSRHLVQSLLEDNPDAVNPKMEMLRNDPGDDLKRLTDALEMTDVHVRAYMREHSVATFYVRLHSQASEAGVQKWFSQFLSGQQLAVRPEEIQVVQFNLQHRGALPKIGDF